PFWRRSESAKMNIRPTVERSQRRTAPCSLAVVLLLVGHLTGASLALAESAKTGRIGDDHIRPKPQSAPGLPPAGETFIDPTFGTRILRLTDPKTAPDGASVNSAAQDSMFNAAGTLFYLHHRSAGTFLYAVNRVTGRVTRLGQLPIAEGFSYDGAAW